MARPGNESGIPPDKQSNIRCSYETHATLRRIALQEGVTVIHLAETVFREFIARYAAADPTINQTMGEPKLDKLLQPYNNPDPGKGKTKKK